MFHDIHIGLSDFEPGSGEILSEIIGSTSRYLHDFIGSIAFYLLHAEYLLLQGRELWGDLDPVPQFSLLKPAPEHPRQVPCWITRTNQKVHDIILANLDRSPMYTGVIHGIGPRYCPSIEDKVKRFADKDSHQVFLEPEGLHVNEWYPNGISTSLPFDVQLDIVHNMPGLEHAHLLRPGYAIEYDFYDPRGLKTSMETKAIAKK